MNGPMNGPAPGSHSGAAFERNAPYAPTPDNRPAPLDSEMLPLAGDAGWQMSFGERAAFEGVLAQVRPRLAVEIGTAEAGSLERIAAYSEEVHSIDLTHEPVTRALPGHVTLHTGSSSELLPPLLASFAGAGRSVDFALVDGDHSYEGVRADLLTLLASPAVRHAVILVHDTTNAEVRAGVESVGLEGYEQVSYVELDFVPGYIYREGTASGAAWGGIGLVITGERRSPGYADRVRQWRYHEAGPILQDARARLAQEAGRGEPGG